MPALSSGLCLVPAGMLKGMTHMQAAWLMATPRDQFEAQMEASQYLDFENRDLAAIVAPAIYWRDHRWYAFCMDELIGPCEGSSGIYQ